MREPDAELKSLERLFAQARHDLAGVESVRAGVDERVAKTSVRARQPMLPWCLVGVALLAGLGSILWLRRGGGGAPVGSGTGVVLRDGLHAEPVLTLRVDDLELVAHVAAMLDGRTVLIVWSGTGGVRAGGAKGNQAGGRVGRYTRYPLPPGKLSNGRLANYCMYFADEGIRPAVEPPTVVADTGAGRAVAFSVSPRVTAADELPAALSAAGLILGDGVSIADVYRELHKHAND